MLIYLFGICLCSSMLTCLLNLQIFVQNDTFSILAIFCNHSKHKSQINTQSKHLNHLSNKTARRKFFTVTFIFWPLRGAKNGLNAHPSLGFKFKAWHFFRFTEDYVYIFLSPIYHKNIYKSLLCMSPLS